MLVHICFIYYSGLPASVANFLTLEILNLFNNVLEVGEHNNYKANKQTKKLLHLFSVWDKHLWSHIMF